MPIPLFLAMTPQEYTACRSLPPKIAWMSVHFSSFGRGLSNCPGTLPEGSIVILDDMIPWNGHNTETIVQQLKQILLSSRAAGLLLDFERAPGLETLLLTAALSRLCQQNHIPIAAPLAYKTGAYTETFIPPFSVPIQACRNQKVWRDLSLFRQTIKIGPSVTEVIPRNPAQLSNIGLYSHMNLEIPCFYKAWQQRDCLYIHMVRDKGIVQEYLRQGRHTNVRYVLGLWSEFKQCDSR